MEKLTGKKILITGATGGIGAAAARMLAGSGAEVFISGRNEQKLNLIAAELSLPPYRVLACDLTDSKSVKKMAGLFHFDERPADILINASGIGIIRPFELLTEEDFERCIQVNLMGAFRLIQEILPPMKSAGRGLIINIPGVLGKSPMAGASAYAASKYGLNGMIKSLREELKRTEIRITQLYFGGVDSSFWDNVDLRVQREKMIVATEAGKTIWFLCQQPLSGVVSEMVVQPFNHQVV